jgi:16S rRNA processing protein RimM
MDLVYIGNIAGTHGLKGEIRIISSFEYKDKIFKSDFNLYIDEKPYKIITYRKHKNFDMVLLEGLDNIDLVIPFKGKKVYINRNDLEKDLFLEIDYIGMDIYSDKGKRGTVKAIVKGNYYNYLEVELNNKKYYIPNVCEFIKEIDKKNNKILINEIEGLIDEN